MPILAVPALAAFISFNLILGRRETCPCNEDDTGNMIRHDDKFITLNIGNSTGNCQPQTEDYFFQRGKVFEVKLPIEGANGYKISIFRRVINRFHANGTAMMYFRVQGHFKSSHTRNCLVRSY